MKYRKKPVEVKAWTAREIIQSAKNNWNSLPKEIRAAYEKGGWVFMDEYISIPTLEGTHKAGIEDMIIMGIAGEFYPCKMDIFKKTYE
jgi:hypothetical protein